MRSPNIVLIYSKLYPRLAGPLTINRIDQYDTEIMPNKIARCLTELALC